MSSTNHTGIEQIVLSVVGIGAIFRYTNTTGRDGRDVTAGNYAGILVVATTNPCSRLCLLSYSPCWTELFQYAFHLF